MIKKVAEISTIIGKETIFEGNLTVNSSIRIDGQVNGKVICSGDVTIGKEGLVKKLNYSPKFNCCWESFWRC
ncbi:MAG: polymer-forming cytoskeletal protein [Bacillaceae bacterium]|nr:polymer-forming cytoskeletal protein [Bacillaceae bacterium]